MTNPTDANGRQRTPTDATRPLRETVAEAMHRVRYAENPGMYYEDWQVEVDKESRSTVFTYVSFTRKEADAAIAAMVDALLSDEAVEAVPYDLPRLYDENGVEVFYPLLVQKTLESSLRRIGAVEGERQ